MENVGLGYRFISVSASFHFYYLFIYFCFFFNCLVSDIYSYWRNCNAATRQERLGRKVRIVNPVLSPPSPRLSSLYFLFFLFFSLTADDSDGDGPIFLFFPSLAPSFFDGLLKATRFRSIQLSSRFRRSYGGSSCLGRPRMDQDRGFPYFLGHFLFLFYFSNFFFLIGWFLQPLSRSVSVRNLDCLLEAEEIVAEVCGCTSV